MSTRKPGRVWRQDGAGGDWVTGREGEGQTGGAVVLLRNGRWFALAWSATALRYLDTRSGEPYTRAVWAKRAVERWLDRHVKR